MVENMQEHYGCIAIFGFETSTNDSETEVEDWKSRLKCLTVTEKSHRHHHRHLMRFERVVEKSTGKVKNGRWTIWIHRWLRGKSRDHLLPHLLGTSDTPAQRVP